MTKRPDLVVMVVDPSHEAILLAERAKTLTAEAKKDFTAVLNKVDAATEPFLRRDCPHEGFCCRARLVFRRRLWKPI